MRTPVTPDSPAAPAPDTTARDAATIAHIARQLLDREPPEGYLAEWTHRTSQPRLRKRPGTISTVIFRIGSEWFALPSRYFLEVADVRTVHSLPHRPAADPVQGVVNVRGELLLCLSLAYLLGFSTLPGTPSERQQALPRLLVMGQQSGRVAFPVDEVHVGTRYHPEELQPVPATVGLAAAAHTTGLLAWQGHTVGVLDGELVFYTLNRHFA